MTSLFSFSSPIDIDIRLDDEHDRKTVEIKTDSSSKETCPVYFDGETLAGTVRRTTSDFNLTGGDSATKCKETNARWD